jgi:hypothetical protein
MTLPTAHPDLACMTLSNVSRDESCAVKIVRWMEGERTNKRLVYNVVDCLAKMTDSRHHLASFLANITQVKDVRRMLLDKDQCVMERLVSFINFPQSLVRRKGVVAAIRNCSFETDSHDCYWETA